jgi:hypothetical protein
MSTNAAIIAKTSDGKKKAIYLHWDGYPDHAGEMLKNYDSQELVDELIALGDLSSIEADSDSCIAYGRDRGESGTEATEIKSTDNLRSIFPTAEFIYRWDGKKWNL